MSSGERENWVGNDIVIVYLVKLKGRAHQVCSGEGLRASTGKKMEENITRAVEARRGSNNPYSINDNMLRTAGDFLRFPSTRARLPPRYYFTCCGMLYLDLIFLLPTIGFCRQQGFEG